MFQRIVFLGAAVLAVLWATASPGQVYAQHGRGSFHSGFRDAFGGFDRRFPHRRFGAFDRGLDRRFFDPRFGRFDRRFDWRFFRFAFC